MKIEIQSIKLQNFLSVKEHISFEFRYGLDIVIARNGTGKSAVFLDALCFAFYNCAYRDITLKQLVNRDVKKNTLVEVDFKIGDTQYRVRRGLEPKIFEVIRNGSEELHSSANDLQSVLENTILKTSRKLFKSIVALNSDFAKNWLNMSSNDKAEILKWITDSEIFKSLKGSASSRLKDLRSELENVMFQSNLLQEQKFQFEKQQLQIAETDNSTIENLTSDIRLLESNISMKAKDAELYSNTQKKLDEIEARLFQLKNAILLKKSHIDKMEQINCPKCGEVFYAENLDDKNQDLKADIKEFKKLNAERTQIIDQAALFEKEYNDYNELVKQLELKRFEKSTLESKPNTAVSFTDEIESIERKIAAISATQLRLQKDIDLYIEVLNILKSSNVQDYLSKQLTIFNKVCNAIFSDFFIEEDISIDVDGGFNVNIKKEVQSVSFQSMSSGERSRVGFSILLGFINFLEMKNSVSWNILIFDEVLDVAFDYNGRDALIRIFKTFSHRKNIVLISHNSEIEEMSAEFNRKIYLNKKNGTQLEEHYG